MFKKISYWEIARRQGSCMCASFFQNKHPHFSKLFSFNFLSKYFSWYGNSWIGRQRYCIMQEKSFFNYLFGYNWKVDFINVEYNICIASIKVHSHYEFEVDEKAWKKWFHLKSKIYSDVLVNTQITRL